ncbi:MAG: hypothetical protein QG570_604 [Patescibacteria group bacterium]|jgi:hypothetical protein|nr:hypothetical protein [Patescibacteria group bacterium]
MIRDEEKYLTSDIKLQAFLRLMLPNSFVGLNKTNPHRVNFVFEKTKELTELINGYLTRKEYLISPLSFAENIDQGKAMIYGDY